MAFSTPVLMQPIPLTFDRVSDGIPITSPAPLFQFPIELLSQIVKHLSPQDLSALALVDEDCRQLARSIQFARLSLKLKGGNAKDPGIAKLELLEAEWRQPSGTDGMLASIEQRRRRRLGPCIRHLRVHIDQTGVTSYGPHLASRLVALCASAIGVLPNLHVVDWDAPFHPALATSPAKHLRLDVGAWPTRPFGFTPVIRAQWGLESLILDILDEYDTGTEVQSVCAVLRASGATLRTLSMVWRYRGKELLMVPREAIELALGLPELREVWFEGLNVTNTDEGLTLMDIDNPQFASKRITSLSIIDCDPSLYQLLGSYHLPSLRTLRLDHSFPTRPSPLATATVDPLTPLLAQHTHISALELDSPIPNSVLERLLSVLANEFTNLRALKIVFDSHGPSDVCLSLLASIPALEVLWLSAGTQEFCLEWASEWEVDHERLIDAFTHSSSGIPTRPFNNSIDHSNFPSLKTLIFTRDTYRTPTSAEPVHPLFNPSAPTYTPRFYYQNRQLPPNTYPEDFLSPAECEAILGAGQVDGAVRGFDFEAARRGWRHIEHAAWERWHVARMREVAGKWGGEVGRLEACYVGMVPFVRAGGEWEVEGRGEEGGRDVDGWWVRDVWKAVLQAL